MSKAWLLVAVGGSMILLSKYLTRANMSYHKTFFSWWAEMDSWGTQVMYILIGSIVLLLGIAGLYYDSQ